MPKTANDQILDALVRHQVYLQRIAIALGAEFNKSTDKTVDELAGFVQRQEGLNAKARMTAGFEKEVNKTLRGIERIRKPGFKAGEESMREGIGKLVVGEKTFVESAIKNFIGDEIRLKDIPDGKINNILALGKWDGKNMEEWFESLRKGEMIRVEKTIRSGLVAGQTLDEISKSIVGTRANGYTDGVINTTRRGAEFMARTVQNGVTNAARNELYERNSDIISSLRFTATLDGRTTIQCASLDGKEYKIGEAPQPPLHENCRSIIVPVIDGFGVIGDRPAIGGTNFQTEAYNEYISKRLAAGDSETEARDRWAELSNRAKNSMRREQMAKWDKEVVGTVPAKTTYDEWLRTQPPSFQDDVLGKTYGEIFRSGAKDKDGNPVTISTFVDQNKFKPYTIDELMKREPQLFKEAKKEGKK